jgi:hypothetical protein
MSFCSKDLQRSTLGDLDKIDSSMRELLLYSIRIFLDNSSYKLY